MPPGRLVHAARLHADETVLDQIEPADAIIVAELVQRGEQGRGAHRLAVDRDWIALLEGDLDDGRLVGRVLGMNGARIDVSWRLLRRILQNFALGGDVQQVGIGRKRRFAALVLGDRNLVLFGEGEKRVAGGEAPFSPRRDDLDVGLERIGRQFVAHLVVALAGRAVRDGVGADLARDLDQVLGDQRPGDRGAEQILALVLRVGAEHREHVIAHELLATSSMKMCSGLTPIISALRRAGSSSSPWPRSAVKVMTSAPYSVCSHLRMIDVSNPPE